MCVSSSFLLIFEFKVNELPDALSDFILKYSRRYSTSSPEADADIANSTRSPSSRKSSTSERSADSSPKHQRHSAPAAVAAAASVSAESDSGSGCCDSPMTAGSAPQRSPAAPRGGQSGPSTPSDIRLQSQVVVVSALVLLYDNVL